MRLHSYLVKVLFERGPELGHTINVVQHDVHQALQRKEAGCRQVVQRGPPQRGMSHLSLGCRARRHVPANRIDIVAIKFPHRV